MIAFSEVFTKQTIGDRIRMIYSLETWMVGKEEKCNGCEPVKLTLQVCNRPPGHAWQVGGRAFEPSEWRASLVVTERGYSCYIPVTEAGRGRMHGRQGRGRPRAVVFDETIMVKYRREGELEP